MKLKIIIVMLLAFGAIATLGAQTAAKAAAQVVKPSQSANQQKAKKGPKKPATAAPNAAAAKANKSKSLHEVRKETLLYGIDSQIESLLATLTENKDNSLDPEVAQIFGETQNRKVKRDALTLLSTVKDWRLAKGAITVLDDRIQNGDTSGDRLVITAIRYLRGAGDASALPEFTKLMTDQSHSVAFEAISSIGKLGGEKQAAMLLKDLESASYSQALKPQLVLALGEIKSKSAVPELTKILKDQNQSAIMRRYACDALGNIGDPSSISAITGAFSSSDTYLRAYAVSALAHFKGAKVDSMLTGALKDSFWRVRVNAAQSLGKKQVASAIPILEYKARYDPQLVVQQAAIKALGEIDTPKSMDFLRKAFSNSLVNPSLRTVALTELVNKDLAASLPDIEKYLNAEWQKPVSHLFDYTCKELSQAKDPKLEPLYERFLTSSNLNIQIYGIRGIGGNGFKGLLKKVKAFDQPKVNTSVRAAAENAIAKLK